MKTFVDHAGRTWTLQIHVEAVKRVRGLVNVDLMQAVEGQLIERLVSDPVLLCDVIYALCQPEAQANHVSDVEFGRAMGGDALEAATTALLEELVGFFPPGQRRVLSKALAKLRQLEQVALKAVEARIDSPELDERLAAALATPGTWSTSAPASLA